MRIFMTGGTGFVGSALTSLLCLQGHRVTILTRSAVGRRPPSELVTYLQGDPTREGSWQEQAAAHDGVINLAGESIFQRWTRKVKRKLRDSRILTTRNLVQALSQPGPPGRFLISASAVGYYGFREDEELDEDSSPGDDFLARLAREWEAQALAAESQGVRVVITRLGIVLGKEGGALAQMVPLFRKFLGGPLGNGRQWFSWIHLQDLARIFLFLLDHTQIKGPVNCTAPHPVRNRELARTLGRVLARPAFMRAPGFLIRLTMGEFGSVVLKGQRVVPRKLLHHGFQFRFGELYPALKDLLAS